jgi:molybdate/tungstate transport system ATP-binding protein
MIRTEELTFHIGTFRLDRLTLAVPAGKYFVLLGPPGAGKSMLLECLCGLRRVDAGRIFIDGHDVTHAEPRLRGIGYVPQDYALFPHLSVRENITFGLRRNGCPRARTPARIQDITQLLKIEHLLDRRIAGLSGGEQQRVALARALVLQPRVLLLDEPVCALDEATRQEVCAQLLHLQRQLQLTVVHVSHNLEEAFSVADYAAILHQGQLQQAGPIDELLRRPNCEFVARFVRAENIFSGHAKARNVGKEEYWNDGMMERRNDGTARNSSIPVLQSSDPSPYACRTRVELDNAAIDVPGQHEGAIKFMIRPDHVLVLPEGEPAHDGPNRFELQLTRWRDCGAYVRLELTGPIQLVAHVTPAVFHELEHRPRVTAVLPLASIHVLP